MGTFTDSRDGKAEKCAIVVQTLPKPISQVLAEVITMLAMLCVAAFAQQKGSFTDPRDGKKYKTVKIGTQTWMAENLNYKAEGSRCYGEGGQVRDTRTEDDYMALSNKEVQANCVKYGRLYNLATAMSVCPSGWDLPSPEEWNLLMDFVDGNARKLKAKRGWGNYYPCDTDYETCKPVSGNGQDTYGFSLLPGGYGYSDGKFNGVGREGSWWSSPSDRDVSNYAYLSDMSDYHGVIRDLNSASTMSGGLFSVRCMQGVAHKKFVINYENGVPHGEWKKFHKNGKLNEVGNYKEGKLHGELKMFYENGNLHSITNYKEGILHGEQKYFDVNASGKLDGISNYKDGKRHGEQKIFNDWFGQINGSYSVENYIENEKNGETIYFDENGKLMQGEWKISNYVILNFKDGVLQK